MDASLNVPALFRPIDVGKITLKHRVVMAPLTRFKSTEKEHVPLPIMKTYYTQRASTPGTLIITEATFIAPRAGGYTHAPGIWSDEQIKAWKEITDAVHSKGCFMYMQLWALGRAGTPSELYAEDPSLPFVSASDIRMSDYPPPDPAPRALTVEEIHEYVQLYATAASNAVLKAGFDGVEIHSANGYLLDQFLQDVSNKRTDEYGGSVGNRCRFTLEVADSVANAVGVERMGIRVSPWSLFQDMGMKDPKPTFSYLISKLKERYPNMSYIHAIEPRIKGNATVVTNLYPEASNDFLRELWAPRPYISAGAHTRESALQFAENGAARARGEKAGELVAFGRHFLANPDLPVRLEKNILLNPHDRDLFYVRGDISGKGYTDYRFATADVL